MDTPTFTRLLDRMMRAAEAGDGDAFAACFTDDAIYHDYIYGPHAGRAADCGESGSVPPTDAASIQRPVLQLRA